MADNADMVHSLQQPGSVAPVVLDIPHAGRVYPDDFNYCCNLRSLQLTEDRYADLFYSPLFPGAHSIVVANFSRTYIDVNKAPDSMLALRLRAADGNDIYSAPVLPDEYDRRLEKCYHPYMQALELALDRCVRDFGVALHFNLHSYISYRVDKVSGRLEQHPMEICLGDVGGSTAHPSVVPMLGKALESQRFSVSYNRPFPGGHIVRAFGRLKRPQVHSVQIEIRRNCYLTDDLLLDNEKLVDTQRRFFAAFSQASVEIVEILRAQDSTQLPIRGRHNV